MLRSLSLKKGKIQEGRFNGYVEVWGIFSYKWADSEGLPKNGKQRKITAGAVQIGNFHETLPLHYSLRSLAGIRSHRLQAPKYDPRHH
jgi:hypothetical protein